MRSGEQLFVKPARPVDHPGIGGQAYFAQHRRERRIGRFAHRQQPLIQTQSHFRRGFACESDGEDR